MPTLDRELWAVAQHGPYSPEKWNQIIHHVTDRLGKFLEQPFDCEPPHKSSVSHSHRMFCIEIFSRARFARPFDLSFKGILGGTVLGRDERFWVSATLFLYSRGKKLVTKDRASFVELEYLPVGPDGGAWQVKGWQRDEHYEYGYFDADDER